METPDPHAAHRTWRSYLWHHPSAALFALQLLAIVIYPFMEGDELARALFETVAILLLALVVRSISSRWIVWSAVVIAIAAGVLSILDALSPNRELVIVGGLLHAFLYIATAGSLLRYMLEDQRVTVDELFAVGATFTVVAWAFAYIYVVAQAIEPGAFTAAVNPDDPRSWVELIFLSVTTLTSTGLSDVVPITAHARSLVMIEQIVGLGYVALVVSRIVGLTITRSRDDS